MKANQRWLIVR